MDEPLTSVWGGGPTALQVVLWIATAAAALSVRRVVRAAAFSAREWGLLGAVVLAAFLARLLGAPATILHDNSHAYTDIMLSQSLIVDGTHFYGNGYFTFWYHLFRLVPGSTTMCLLHANALMDACTAGLVGLLAALLSGRGLAAPIAAALWAVMPVAVKIGHTESYFILCGFLGSLGWTLGATAIRGRSVLAAIAGGLVLGYAAHVRPEMALLPILSMLLAFSAAPESRDLVRRPHAAIFWIVQAGVSAPAAYRSAVHFFEGAKAAQMLDYASLGTFASLFGVHGSGEAGNVFVHWGFTPPTYALLFVFGVAAAWKLRARWAIFPVFAPLIVLIAVLPIQNAPWVSMRLQHAALYLFCVLPAAAVVSRPWAWLTPRRGAALGAAACLSSLLYSDFVVEMRAPQREFEFLREAVPLLPNHCTIAHPGHDREIVAELPAWLSRESGLDHRWIATDADGGVDLPPGSGCLLWYRGASCFAAPRAGYGAPEGGMRPACAGFERAHATEPALVTEIPGGSDTFYSYSRDALPIGFHRVRGPRP